MTKKKQYLQSTTKNNQDLATRTSRKTGAELRCSGRVRNYSLLQIDMYSRYQFKLVNRHVHKIQHIYSQYTCIQ